MLGLYPAPLVTRSFASVAGSADHLPRTRTAHTPCRRVRVAAIGH